MTNIDEIKEIKVIRKDVDGVTKEPSRDGLGVKLGLEELQMLLELIRCDIAEIGNAQDRKHTRKLVREKLEKRWSRVWWKVRNHP